MTDPSRRRQWLPRTGQACIAVWLALPAWCPPAFAQDRPALAESVATLPTSFGVEVAFRSGHADRGFVINDRPVVQPVTWVSGRGTSFSVWTSFPLAATTDGSRPQILELELGREHGWGKLTIAPAVRTYFYHDPISPYSTRSIEGWLYLSYAAGPLRLFTNHSVDLLTYRGAYFGEAGIGVEGNVSQRLEIGGSAGAGWASAAFNDAWVGIHRFALNRVSVEGWLTAYVQPGLYIGPHFEYSAIVDDQVRGEAWRPTFFFVRLTTGVEF